jgi:hypothetical protein
MKRRPERKVYCTYTHPHTQPTAPPGERSFIGKEYVEPMSHVSSGRPISNAHRRTLARRMLQLC